MANNSGLGMLPVPTNTAFVIRNDVRQTATVRERGKEIIGSFTFLKDVPARGKFPVVEYNLDPLYLEGTRLQSLCKSFQKYRFGSGTKFVVQCNAPTSTTGGYVAGYTENPDQNMGTGSIATSAISAMQGSASGPVWVTQAVSVNVRDKAKWYNVDSDTIEIMSAIQGKMVIQQTAAVSTTNNIVVPVWLEWNVELTGAAVQILEGSEQTTAILPYGVCKPSPDTDNTAFHRNEVGVTITPGPGATSTLAARSLYQIVPGFETATGETANYVWLYPSGATSYYLFAGSEDQAINGNYFNWATLFGLDAPLELQMVGAVAYFINDSADVPLPGRRMLTEDELGPLTINFQNELRLKASSLARESVSERQTRLIETRNARLSLLKQ